MNAACGLDRGHIGAQVDPELGIVPAETDCRGTCDEPRQAKRRQCRFVKAGGPVEIADANRNMIEHNSPLSVIARSEAGGEAIHTLFVAPMDCFASFAT